MGMDQKVIFPPINTPSWAEFAELLAKHQYPVQLRMIDGELALPDEAPPHDWRELRVSTSAGMVTLRRDGDGITLVIWGNADANMRQAWNALTWALATLTGGSVRSAAGEMTLEDFVKTAELPEGFV
jgi:hypothetical protein